MRDGGKNLVTADCPTAWISTRPSFPSSCPISSFRKLSERPSRVRCRLIGTEVVHATGLNFAGHYLDQLIPPGDEESWMAHYRRCRETACPIYGLSTVDTLAGGAADQAVRLVPALGQQRGWRDRRRICIGGLLRRASNSVNSLNGLNSMFYVVGNTVGTAADAAKQNSN